MDEEIEHSHNGIPPNYTSSYYKMCGILRFLFTVAFATRPYPLTAHFIYLPEKLHIASWQCVECS